MTLTEIQKELSKRGVNVAEPRVKNWSMRKMIPHAIRRGKDAPWPEDTEAHIAAAEFLMQTTMVGELIAFGRKFGLEALQAAEKKGNASGFTDYLKEWLAADPQTYARVFAWLMAFGKYQACVPLDKPAALYLGFADGKVTFEAKQPEKVSFPGTVRAQLVDKFVS